MTQDKKYSVLVVDDIESIRFAISDYLKSYFVVHEADNGRKAIEILENNHIDLVLTDIRMPEMGGLELIAHITKSFPGVKYALMTAYNVNDYIKFVRKMKIWNIIPKTTFLDLRFIKVMSEKLLTNDIFGIDKYYPGCNRAEISREELEALRGSDSSFQEDVYYTLRIESVTDYDKICETVGEILIERGAPSIILQVLEELATNALIRAPRNAYQQRGRRDDTRREQASDYEDGTPNAYELSFGIMEKNAVISVTDYHGTLNRDEILYRLERHVTMDKNGLPLGINDSHGRGLFISREHMDHLVFNIQPRRRTQVIGILSLENDLKYRAVSIYQQDEE